MSNRRTTLPLGWFFAVPFSWPSLSWGLIHRRSSCPAATLRWGEPQHYKRRDLTPPHYVAHSYTSGLVHLLLSHDADPTL
ncbi:MAG: hypothetical protein ACO2PN_21645 [Pyrobaculum sp.]